MLDLALIFLRLGATSFGGPLAHIALMRQEFVEKRGWLSDAEFLDLSGAVNLIPGPNSTELAMHIGHKRGGFVGTLVAGFCFIGPAMLMVIALAALYAKYGTLPAARAILWGVQPVVVVIVIQALLKFAPAALKNYFTRALAALAIVGAIAGLSEVALIFIAAFIGLALAFGTIKPPPKSSNESIEGERIEGGGDAPRAAFVLIGLKGISLTGIFWTFAKMGALVYGSGYVLLAYLRAELVENLGWVSDRQLLDAVAVGQVTPGPVFTTATFLGYQIGGLSGALLATAGIFGPSFLFVGLLAVWMERTKDSPRARLFLDCVNAASFALMGVVTWQLLRATLIIEVGFDWRALLIGLVAAGLVWKTKINAAWLLAGAALVGFALHRGA